MAGAGKSGPDPAVCITISPLRRADFAIKSPAHSGYFNALVAPAALLPLVRAAIVESWSLAGVFAVSLAAAVLQFLTIRRLRGVSAGSRAP